MPRAAAAKSWVELNPRAIFRIWKIDAFSREEGVGDRGVFVWERGRRRNTGGGSGEIPAVDGSERVGKSRRSHTGARSSRVVGEWKRFGEEAGKRHGERLRREGKVSSRRRIPVRQSGQRMGGGAGTAAESSGTGAVMEALWSGTGVSKCLARSSRERQAGLKMP